MSAQIAPHHGGEVSAQRTAGASPIVDYRAGGGPVWSEDFSSGWPAGWTLQDASGICPWKWTTRGSHGYWNGTNGTTYGDTIASTTAANGFLIADNDSANHFNFGQPSGTTYQYLDTRFTTSAIDLTGHPYVRLEFEQFFRYNNAPALEVKVSADSVNWTTWEVKGTTLANAASPNVDLVRLNISAVAGDQPTVYIQIGWNSRVYFWQIDDMRITDAPANDLRLNEVNYSEWFFDTAPDFAALEYSIYPVQQLRPLTFKGEFTNEGHAEQTDVTLDVEVTDGGGGAVHNVAASLPSLMPLTGDSLYPLAWMPDASYDDYTVTFTVSSDSIDADDTDNQLTKSYSVSESTFARDRNSLSGRYNNQGGAYNLGNWYHVVNEDELASIDVAIDDDTPVGVLITGTLWDADRNPIATTEDYTIQASDLNAAGGDNFTELYFSAPVGLDAGTDYFVSVDHYGGADDLWTGTSGVSLPQTSLIYDATAGDWFYVTATPMVRMGFSWPFGIGEPGIANTISLGQNQPNPANDETVIAFELQVGGMVSLLLRDARGRVFLQTPEENLGIGRQMFTIDTRSLPGGVYFYTVSTNGTDVTRRMTVIH